MTKNQLFEFKGLKIYFNLNCLTWKNILCFYLCLSFYSNIDKTQVGAGELRVKINGVYSGELLQHMLPGKGAVFHGLLTVLSPSVSIFQMINPLLTCLFPLSAGLFLVLIVMHFLIMFIRTFIGCRLCVRSNVKMIFLGMFSYFLF